MYDATDSANNKISPRAFFNALGNVSSIALPDALNDKVITYDADAGEIRYLTTSQFSISRTLLAQIGGH